MLAVVHYLIALSMSCEVGQYADPKSPDGTICLECHQACLDCSGPGADECVTCNSSFAKIHQICMENCPIGYLKSNSQCIDETPDGIVFDLDFTQIKNSLNNKVEISEKVSSSAGNSSEFYPAYDPFDPFPIKNRGFYFDGSAYIQNQGLTFAPVFTMALWVRSQSGSGTLYTKQSSSNVYIKLSLSNYKLKFSLLLMSLKTFTSSNSLTPDKWDFLFIKLFLTSAKSKLSLKINKKTENSPVFSTYYEDIYTDYFSTIGALIENDSYSKFFNGFLWSFILSNQNLNPSLFLQSSSCSGCSTCPKDFENQCLSLCNFNEFTENSNCKPCKDTCQTGCVRNDETCNLCSDVKCLKCLNFESSCQECTENSELVDGVCKCKTNTWWDSSLVKCRACNENCVQCDGGGYLGCSKCRDSYFMLVGICVQFCPLGYLGNSGGNCELENGKRIVEFVFDQIEGVVYDKANQVPAVTGNSAGFYPEYEENDPFAVYKRGYYFNGKSLMHLAPYLEYNQPFISFPPVFYSAFWLSSTNSQGIILSSVDSEYKIKLKYELKSQHPAITISLSQNSSETSKVVSHTCDLTTTLHSWSYFVFKIELSSNEETILTCYLNSVSTKPVILANGYFSDTGHSNSMVLGSQKIGDFEYSSNKFIGFIYQFIVDTDISTPLFDFSLNCTDPCSICPLSVCLSDCHIKTYPTPDQSACLSCSTECSEYGCRSSDSNCNLCEDSTCKVCSGYSDNDCQAYNCPDGTYKKKGMSTCKACHSDCLTCNDYGASSCTSCNSTYLLNSACSTFCPTGYESLNSSCILTSEKVISLKFDQIQRVADENSNLLAVSGNGTGAYPHFGVDQPWPVMGRGYYFTGRSYLQLPPNSLNETEILIGFEFTLAFWLKSEKNGCLISKQDSEGEMGLGVRVLNEKVSILMRLDSLQGVNSSLDLSTGWNYLTVLVEFSKDGTTKCSFTVNLIQESFVVGPGRFRDIEENSVFLLGAFKDSQGFEELWTGMIFSFSLYSVAIAPKELTKNCNGECSVCPITLGTCINECDHNTWWDGENCVQCSKCEFGFESCRRPDSSCNLCQDTQCEICDNFLSGSCTKCIENAELNDGKCSCKDHYTWDPNEETCVMCDPSNKVTLLGICLETCPTGYSDLSGKCEGTSSSVFYIKLDDTIKGSLLDSKSNIRVITGLTSEFYPYYELSDPIAVKNRGYYFNGISTFMQFDDNSNLILSPSFTLTLWTFPKGPGTIFSKQYEENPSFQLELNSNKTMKISIKLTNNDYISEVFTDSNIKFFEWNFLGVTLTLQDDLSTLITIAINKEVKTSLLGVSPFIDYIYQSTYTIGANYNSSHLLENFYQGYIRSIQIWNFPKDPLSEILSNCEGSCEICPKSGTCLNNCEYFQYYSGDCNNCSETCSTGCVRQEDCNLCLDRLCEKCSDYSLTGCYKCVDGAVMKDGECKCENGETQIKENGNFYCKVNCMEYCSGCYSMQNGDCWDCKEGYYLENSGLCLPQCQTGYEPEGSQCNPITQNSKILHFVFNSTVNQQMDLVNEIPAFSGSSYQYLPNFDSNDPIPLYHRGLYFNSSSKYITIGNNSNELQSIVLGNTHSIQLWLRPIKNSKPSCILSKESEFQYTYLYLDSSLKPYAQYKVSSIFESFSSNFIASGKPLDSDTWQELLIVFQRNGRLSTTVVFVNGIGNPTSYAFKSFFEEPKDLVFTLGYSALAKSSFFGFIYELSVYNFAINSVDPDDYDCYCEKCTASGDCLSNCGAFQYISEDSCQDCEESCEFGCGSAISCSLHPDPLCTNFTGFLKKDCFLCVELARMTRIGCVCEDFSTLSNLKCECNDQFEAVDNMCSPCFYHISSDELHAYFDEDYLKVIVDFDYNMNEGSSSDCQELLDSQTFKVFGRGVECIWIDNMKKLEIKLGIHAQVVISTVLGFYKNALYTRIKMCGSYRAPVLTEVVKKYDPPFVSPLGIINGPSFYFTPCGDLLITGKNSLGGYGRKLTYNWEFESGPALPIFSSNFTNETLFFSNFSLSDSNLTVFLTVTNWLGFNSTVSQAINISDNIGINLNYDYTINWKLTSQQSKSILLTPSSQCNISNSLNYTWSVISKTGEHSYINESLLWNSQKIHSKLFIPKGSLGPGLYTFQSLVEDTELNLTGSTLLHIFVDYSELVINFSPYYFTFDKQKDLVLDGTVAYDPDNITGKFEYFWSCNNGSDCSSILSDINGQQPVINKENLTEFILYSFILIISKGKRTSWDELFVFIDTNSSISLKFPRYRKYMNNQEDFTIKPILDTGCNCKFNWTVTTKSEYNLITDLQSKDIGFAKNTMKEGEWYRVLLNVTDENGGVSRFVDQILVNYLPVDGNFSVEPNSGTAEKTVFEFSAPGWYDLKGENFPVSFQFGYYIDEIEVFVSLKNESSQVFTFLPFGDNIEAFVRVYDSYGSYIEKTVFLSVFDESVELEKVVQNFEKKLAENWFDADLVPGEVFRILFYSSKAQVNQTEAIDTYNVCLYAVQKMIKLVNEVDANIVDVILFAIHQLSNYQVNDNLKESLSELIEFLISQIRENQIPVSTKRALYISKTLQNIYDFSHSLVSMNSRFPLPKINKLLYNLGIASSATLGQSQVTTFGSSALKISFQVHKGNTLTSFQVPSTFNQPSISIPSSKSLKFNSSSTVLSILIGYNTENNDIGKNEFSAAVEFSFVLLDKESPKKLNVNLKSQYLSIAVPVWNPENDVKCVYWDDGKWSSEGCKLDHYSGNVSYCKCKHTSLYSSGSKFLEEYKYNENPIVVIISCLVACFWVLLTCFFLVKDQREVENKEFIDEVLANLQSLENKNCNKVLETELAEKLGKDQPVESSSQKRDSQFVPTARIGVVGAYFQDNADENLGPVEGQRDGNVSHYQATDSSNIKKGFGILSMYEELKESEHSDDPPRPMPQKKKLGISEYQEPELIMPSSELEKIRKSKNPPKLNPEFYYDRASDLSPTIPDPGRHLSLKETPKLGIIITPDSQVEVLEKEFIKRGSEFIPRIADIQDFQTESEKGLSSNSIKKSPKFAKILTPSLESSENPSQLSEIKPVESNFIQVMENDPQKVSLELAENEQAQDKHLENTDLFTAPNSPRSKVIMFTANEQVRRRYSPCMGNYLVSGLCFYHENYSRAVRCSQGVCSYFIYIILIGFVVKATGEEYSKNKGTTVSEIMANIEFQDVAVAFVMTVLANFTLLLIICTCFRNRLPAAFSTEQDRLRILSKNNRKEIFRFAFVSIFIVFILIGIGVLELGMKEQQSVFWFSCEIIAFLLDCFLVQIVKVLIFRFVSQDLILPSY